MFAACFFNPFFFQNFNFHLIKTIMFRILATFLLLSSIFSPLYSQTLTTDSLQKRIAVLEKDFAWAKNLKITGYVQAQWQKADTAGIRSYDGGNFPAFSDNRFMIRRGRVKFAFTQKNCSLVLQPDFSERGVSVRDFFGTITEPWTGHFSLQAGLFNRPFSYELQYSSNLRETPERARFSQTLLPDERDLGAMISWKKAGLKIDFGLVNGNALAGENDSKKDAVARIAWVNPLKIKQLSLGASAYSGSVRQNTKFAYTYDGARAGMVLGDTLNTLGKFAKRQYIGADVQFTQVWKAGKTTIRGEFIVGKQPGTFSADESPRSNLGLVGNVYNRSTIGGLVYFVQNLGKSPFQAVAKYDFFDGNSKVSGDEIGKVGSNLGAADLKYNTLGLGLNFYWKNLLVMAYYDFVKNETSSNLSTHKKDLKDNVFTLRTQVKF
jgi:hypothetical protein